MTEWIAVENELPDRGVDVLVLGKNGSMKVRHIPPYQGGGYAGDDGKSWYPGGWGVGWTTHWMPLPAPPETVEKGLATDG